MESLLKQVSTKVLCLLKKNSIKGLHKYSSKHNLMSTFSIQDTQVKTVNGQ